MSAMPPEINRLYFPIVFPHKKIVSFIAERVGGAVKIVSDRISII
jgi:hypothetical protein